MLRVEVSEAGEGTGGALPPIDVADTAFVIGSRPDARVRLPADAAELAHVTVDGTRYRTVDGDAGEIGDGVVIEVGRYRVRIAPAPPGAVATPPQRTESLARELMRSLFGADHAPTFEVERGPVVGATRRLAPPESSLVIGRGDEAGWIVLDEDLSRTHAEVRRGWDGIRIADLGSKNGTRVDGVSVGEDGVELADGALVELGKVALRFRDPVARRAAAPTAAVAPVTSAPAAARPAPLARPSTLPFYAAAAICVAALGALVWVLSL